MQDGKYERMLEKLIEEVKCLLSNTVDTLKKLELLDNLEKLGLANLFEHEIKNILDTLVSSNNQNLNCAKNLYTTALHFMILRKHGYPVPQGAHIPFAQLMCFFLKVPHTHVLECIYHQMCLRTCWT